MPSSPSSSSVAMRLSGSAWDFSVRGKKFSFLRGKPPLSKSPCARLRSRSQFSCSKGLCQNISVDAENLLLRIIRPTTNSDLGQHGLRGEKKMIPKGRMILLPP